ncbi:MAG: chlorite dismutase family protein, partial [Gemmatimonadota bacterium]
TNLAARGDVSERTDPEVPPDASGGGDDDYRVVSHLALYAFKDAWWERSADGRERDFRELTRRMRDAADVAWFYQVTPFETDGDFLVWTSSHLVDVGSPAAFARNVAAALAPARAWLRTSDVLWGLTRPSQYSRAKSQQEIDPFADERRTYLVIYPFTKTVDWYLLGRDSRQGMMNEHIRLGKQYREISQLLLYSFGLQDQEFVVSYEMEDLALFSDLVYELRDTDARKFTQGDTPLHACVLADPDELAELFSAS